MKVFRRIILAFTFIWNHALVKNERLSAIYRYIKFHFRYRKGQECIIPFLEHSLLIKKGEGSQTNYFTYLADYEEMLFLLHFLSNNDRFIDVGANLGSYTILASGMIGCDTISFEPSDKIYRILNDNVALNNVRDKVSLYNIALGDRDEVKTIGLKGAMTYITNNNSLPLQKINIKKLDSFVNYSSLIKIDVEGYEEYVLKGAKNILNHSKTEALIIELAGYNRYSSSNDKIHNILMKNSFFPIKYHPKIRDFTRLQTYRIDQCNTIYIRDEALAKKRLRNSPKYKIGNQWF